MEEDRHLRAKRDVAGMDTGGWKPGAGLLVGSALALILLVAAIVLGLTTGLGLVVAVPLALVALVIAFFAFTGGGRPRRNTGACPYCGARIEAPSHIAELDCPACRRRVEIRDGMPVRAA
jgi:hypothetical protein